MAPALQDNNGLAISAEHLVRKFGQFTAVNDVSFQVRKGEIFGFLGPNGSGKTTVIKMLTGLLPLTSGKAHVEGIDVRTDPEAVRQNIGYMSQRFSLYDDLTVTENLQFYGRIYSLPPDRLKRRMDEIIQLNSLQPYLNRLAAQLSGGWKQRLALVAPCSTNPSSCFLMSPPPASIRSLAASSGIFSLSFPATASLSSSPLITWTKRSGAATSPTFISAAS